MSIIISDEVKTTSPPRFATEDEFEAWWDEDTKAEYADGEVIMMRQFKQVIERDCDEL
jgi:hypothetical protein